MKFSYEEAEFISEEEFIPNRVHVQISLDEIRELVSLTPGFQAAVLKKLSS